MLLGAMRILAACLALVIHTLHYAHFLEDDEGLVAYTTLLLAYLAGEIWSLRLKEGRFNWLNPVSLASLLTFVLSFGISNVLFFLPDEIIEQVGLEPVATVWMNQLMLLVLFAAMAMWLGYDSRIGRELGQAFQENRFMRQWFVTATEVSRPVLCTFIAVSLAARLLMISLGVYGFSSDYSQLIEGAAYTQYLSLAESLGLLALLGIAIQCFSSLRPPLSDRLLLILILCYEVTCGFLSGFKSQVFLPFVVLGLAYYSQRHRFPRWMLPAVLVGIVAAYSVIEPFRKARYNDASFDGRDLSSIAGTMATAHTEKTDDAGGPGTALSVLARINMTYVASKGIEYSATTVLNADSPNFLGDIVLAPVHAVIPRFLWEGKPFQNIGLWYTTEVMGYGLEDGILSSTAMGPVTYLHFAGGPLAVVIGFFFIGAVQRMLYDGLRIFGGGGLIVFFGLLRLLAMIDSAVNTMFTTIIRLLPLLILAQYFLVRESRLQTHMETVGTSRRKSSPVCAPN